MFVQTLSAILTLSCPNALRRQIVAHIDRNHSCNHYGDLYWQSSSVRIIGRNNLPLPFFGRGGSLREKGRLAGRNAESVRRNLLVASLTWNMGRTSLLVACIWLPFARHSSFRFLKFSEKFCTRSEYGIGNVNFIHEPTLSSGNHNIRCAFLIIGWWNCNFKSVLCEGDGDVVGVVTPLVRGGAQVLHGDQVVELSVLLEVHEREEEEEDGKGQIEVESERGELKERRTCTWMTWRDSELKPRGACDPTSKCDEDCALSVHAQVLCILRVFIFLSLYFLLMWFVSCLSSVLLSFFLLYLYSFRSQFSVVGGILFTYWSRITIWTSMTGPTIVPPGIAAEALDCGFTRGRVCSLQNGMICPKPSSSSGRVL